MPFAQVVETADGKKSVVPLGEIGTGGAGTVDTVARTAATEAKTLAENALPKSGGTMSGDLQLVPTNPIEYEAVGTPERLTQSIIFRGKAGNSPLGQIYTNIDSDGATRFSFRAHTNKANGTGYSLEVVKELDGTAYVSGPSPRANNYGFDLTNTKYVRDLCQTKVNSPLMMYAGGANASDTLNLRDGRGLTPEMPFATLSGLLAFIASEYTGIGGVVVVLQDDMEWDVWQNFATSGLINVKITGPEKTLTIKKILGVLSGQLTFYNINLAFDGGYLAANGMWSSGATLMLGDDVAVSGSAPEFLNVTYNGTAIMRSAITGTVEGRKYLCQFGGRIITNGLGETAIPGSEAGVKDASSIVA